MEVERTPRPVTIYSLELLSYDEASREAMLDVFCSKGTYVRTLCHDLGEALGCGAAMSSLTRTEAAGFSLADCRTLEELQTLVDESRLSEVQTRMFTNGVHLDLNRVRHQNVPGPHAVYGPGNVFLGLGLCYEDIAELVMEKLFLQRS